MTRATIATEIGDIEIELFDAVRPEGRPELHRPRQQGLLRRRRSSIASSPGSSSRAATGSTARSRRSSAAASGPAGPATSSRTSRSRATTRAARWRWPTPGPNTNGSQFFICTDDLAGELPKNYTLFGQVTKGLDVVDGSCPRRATRATSRTSRWR